MVLVVAAGHLSFVPPWGMVPSQEGRGPPGSFQSPQGQFPWPCVSWHAQAAVTCPCPGGCDLPMPRQQLTNSATCLYHTEAGRGGACVSTLSPERGRDPPRFTESGLGSGSHSAPSSAGQGRERRWKSEQVGALGAFSPNLRKQGPPPEGRMKSRVGSGEPQALSHVCVPRALSPDGGGGRGCRWGRKDEVAAGGGRTLSSSARGGTGAAAARPEAGGGSGRSPQGPLSPVPAQLQASPPPALLPCPAAGCSLPSALLSASLTTSPDCSRRPCPLPPHSLICTSPSGSPKGPPLSALTTWPLTAASFLRTHRRSH